MSLVYDSFEVALDHRGDGQYRVHAAASSGREASGALSLSQVLERLGMERRALRRGRLSDQRARIRDWGLCLFEALFSGEIQQIFDRERGRVASQEERGLRLQLKFKGRDQSSRTLQELPWELLYCPSRRQHLACDRKFAIVRFLEVPMVSAPLTGDRPMRVLVLIAPSSSVPLDVERERRILHQSLSRYPDIEIEYVVPPTAAALRALLLEKRYHILHYIGHGYSDESSSSSGLLLEARDGEEQRVRGDEFALNLRGIAQPRVVVLNACHTARGGVGAGQQPFHSVASAMVEAGIPAVVAMREEFSGQSAVAFTDALYRRLLAGDAIEAAVAEARIALAQISGEPSAWATPVLFSRTRDGRVFDFSTPSSAPTGDAAGTVATDSAHARYPAGTIVIGPQKSNQSHNDFSGAVISGGHLNVGNNK